MSSLRYRVAAAWQTWSYDPNATAKVARAGKSRGSQRRALGMKTLVSSFEPQSQFRVDVLCRDRPNKLSSLTGYATAPQQEQLSLELSPPKTPLSRGTLARAPALAIYELITSIADSTYTYSVVRAYLNDASGNNRDPLDHLPDARLCGNEL